MKLYILLAAVLSQSAFSKCPNSCSGHGTCNRHDQCTCFTEASVGFTIYLMSDEATDQLCFKHKTATPCAGELKDGKSVCKFDTDGECKFIAKDNTVYQASSRYGDTQHTEWTGADCSRRTCPRSTSWTEVGANEESQSYSCTHTTEVECADQGLCDRATGLCDCFPGYTGSACQRTECPDDCSGHGTCRSNRDFAYDFAISKTDQMLQTQHSTERFMENYVVTYDEAWDTNHLYGCRCDQGYRGPNCALVECPSANDPLDDKCIFDSNQFASDESNDFVENFQIQKFAATGSQGWIDAYTLSKSAEQFVDICDLAVNADASEVVPGTLCAAVTGPNGEKCVYTPVAGPVVATCKTDASWIHAATPGDKNNHFYDGKVYSCFGAMAGMDCSGRGICDYSTGQCNCFSGYSGTACNEIEEMA